MQPRLSPNPDNSAAVTENPVDEILNTGPAPTLVEPGVGQQGSTPGGEPPPPAPEAGEPAAASAWSEEFRAMFPTIAAKFSDPAKLAESYANLERQFTVFRQAGIEPETALARLIAAGTTAPDGETGLGTGTEPEDTFDPDQFYTEFSERPREAVVGLLSPELDRRDAALIDRFNITLAMRDAWGKVVAKHPDAGQFDKQLEGMSKSIAELAAQGVPFDEAMERALLLVKGAPGNLDAERERIRSEEREKLRGQMLGTAGESGRTGSPPVAPGAGQKIVDEILSAGGGPPPLRPLGG